MPHLPPKKKLKACDACRARKLKCSFRDAAEPALATCDNCARSGIFCVTSQQSKQRRPRSGRVVDALRSDNGSGSGVCDRRDDIEENSSSTWTNIEMPISPFDSLSGYGTSYEPSRDIKITSERTAEVFDFFMRNIYATLPVINFDNFMAQLNQDQDMWHVEFCALAYAIDMLQESYKYKLTPTSGARNVRSCISRIEELRCWYDYAEHPTADTVIVSFALFVAYSVIEKQHRPSLYLLEATKLVDFVRTTNSIENMRIQRLKALLFITASASALLSMNSVWTLDVPCLPEVEKLISWYDVAGSPDIDMASDDIRALDRFATCQLQLMTRIHSTARGGASPDFLGEESVADSISGVNLPASRMVRIVTADLSITQLWFSSDRQRLQNNGTPDDVLKLCRTGNLAESTGRKALAWARSLSHSELRIVGLGKMVNILENMIHLYSLGPRGVGEVDILVRDLMAAISAADYESRYTATLARSAELHGHIASLHKGLACH